jgi:hypothetical protein
MKRHRPRDHRRGRNRPAFSLARLRLREIERIFRLRRFGELDAKCHLLPIAQTLHRVLSEKSSPTIKELSDRLEIWCELNAPIFTTDQIADIARAAMQEPRMDKADALAARLGLTYRDRMALRITTIGSYDLSKAGRARRRKERKRKRDRERAARKRVARGATPRSQALSRTQPWKSEGISRRTWERRRRKAQATRTDAAVSQIRRPALFLRGGRWTCDTTHAQPPAAVTSPFRLMALSS